MFFLATVTRGLHLLALWAGNRLDSVALLTAMVLQQSVILIISLESSATVFCNYPNANRNNFQYQIRHIRVFILRFTYRTFQFLRPIADFTALFMAPRNLQPTTNGICIWSLCTLVSTFGKLLILCFAAKLTSSNYITNGVYRCRKAAKTKSNIVGNRKKILRTREIAVKFARAQQGHSKTRSPKVAKVAVCRQPLMTET